MILLVLRSQHRRSCPLCWDVIGGHVEPGEAPSPALVRELQEEIGITALSQLWLCDIDYTSRVGKPLLLRLSQVSEWTGHLSIANDEHVELRWFAPVEAARLPALALEQYRPVFAELV